MAENNTQQQNNASVAFPATTPSQVIGSYSNYFKIFDIDNDVVTNQNIVTAPLFGSEITKTGPFFHPVGFNVSASVMPMYDAEGSSTASKVYDAVFGVLSGTEILSEVQPEHHAAYSALRISLIDSPTTSSLLMSDIFGSTGSNAVVAISFARANYKQQLDPGNWEIQINSGVVATVSKSGVYIDNSSVATGSYGKAGYRTQIVSGNLDAGPYNTVALGYCYHDLGLLLFNANDKYIGASPFGKIIISASAVSASAALVAVIEGRSLVRLNSTNYFCRANNREFNYSTNPTFANAGTGELYITEFKTNPNTYCTTIGLYNDDNELLAVAKMSQPIQKSFDREFVVRVRMDY